MIGYGWGGRSSDGTDEVVFQRVMQAVVEGPGTEIGHVESRR